MSLFFLYKPHCFFDLGLGTWRGDKGKGLTKESLPETRLPEITEDEVEEVWEAAEEEELMVAFFML